ARRASLIIFGRILRFTPRSFPSSMPPMNSRWLPFGQLILARLREFYREPEALFWVYGFPVLLAVGLGVAFASRKPEPPEVDVATDEPTLAEEVARTLREADMKVELHDHATCDWRLNTG